MDIKAKIEEIVKKLQSDKTLLASFQSEPIKTVKKLLELSTLFGCSVDELTRSTNGTNGAGAAQDSGQVQ